MFKTTDYFDSAIQTALVAAVITVPLFFNKYAVNAFEPEKVYIFRSLALVMLFSWLASVVAKKRLPIWTLSPYSLRGHPLLMPILAWTAANTLSTFFSVDASMSLWGNSIRGMGAYTHLSYLIIFAATFSQMCSLERIKQLITTVILTSVPISLYAIGQRFGIEPITVVGRETEVFRVGSHLGHPVFLAAYFLFIFPLILVRISTLSSGGEHERHSQKTRILLIAMYVAIGFLLLIALFFTSSRGPLFGLLAGIIVFVLLTAVHRNRRRLIIGLIGACALMVCAMLALHSFSNLRWNKVQRPEIQRLSKLLDPESGTGLTRSLQWRMAYEAAVSKRPLTLSYMKPDGLHSVRAIIGYGPDTSKIVSRQYIMPELIKAYGGYFVPDRFHNDFWDTLLTTGIFGLIARFALYGCILIFSLKTLGIEIDLRSRIAFWTSYLGGGILLAIVLGFRIGFGFVGLGFCIGAILGFILFLTYRAIFCPVTNRAMTITSRHAYWVIALVSALVAHFVEISFSFPVGTTALFFWVYVGLIAAIARILSQQRERGATLNHQSHPPIKASLMKHDKRRPPIPLTQEMTAARSSLFEKLVAGLVFGLILGTIGFDLLPGNRQVFSWWICITLILSWIIFGIIWAKENYPDSGQKPSLLLGGTLASSIFIGLLFPIILTSRLLSGQPIVKENAGLQLTLLAKYTDATWLYYGFLLLTTLLMAFIQPNPEINSTKSKKPHIGQVILMALLCLLGLAGIYQWNLRYSLAAIAAARAKQSGSALACTLYQDAIKQSPSDDTYRYLLGKTLVEQAIHSANTQDRLRLFADAARILEDGNHLSPINPDFNSAMTDLYLNQALLESDKLKRMALSRDTQNHISCALALEPANGELWYRQAVLDLIVRGNPSAAFPSLQRALDVLPGFDKAHALIGDAYAIEAQAITSAEERKRLLTAAAIAYERAIAIAGPQYLYCNALAVTYGALDDQPKAIDLYLKSFSTAPAAQRWRIDRDIAQLYFKLGDRNKGLRHLQRAIEQSNDEQKKELTAVFRTVLN
jgi:tetratricopeptide (TPR) repeat protein/O-antigen ligase